MPRTKQIPRRRVQFQHDESTTPLTVTRRTSIQMPDRRGDQPFVALFVLDEVPQAMIDEVLEKNAEHTADYFFWLAEKSFTALPLDPRDGSTKPPIPANWVSPFSGRTVEDAFRFLATIPLDKNLGREFIAVLDSRLYRERDWLVIYRIDGEGEITSIPCKAELTCMQLRSYNNHNWPTFMDDWLRKGKPVLA